MMNEHTDSLQNLAAMFSDMYKDVYGFRPRGFITADWTAADYERELALLDVALQEVLIREKSDQRLAVERFEGLIANLLNSGARDRATALRWLHDAEGTNGDDGYLEYTMGIPYGYIKEVA